MKRIMMTIGAAMMTVLALADGESFAYQGVLCDDTGTPISSQTKTIAFRLYDAATNGAKKLWGRRIAVRTDAKGLFNVELNDTQGNAETGASNTLAMAYAATTKMGNPLYIALEVDGSSGEIRPRQKLLATPVAAFAQDLNYASDTLVVKGKATFAGGINVTGGCYNLMPTNMIVMWYGSKDKVPQGWRICDGQYGTPNMIGKFPVGATNETDTTYRRGNTGGAERVTLTENQMPSHSHGFKYPACNASSSGTETYGTVSDNPFDGKTTWDGWKGFRAVRNTGGGQSHENRPPFRALYFIMRTDRQDP